MLISSGVMGWPSVTASDELPRSYMKAPLLARERIPIGRIFDYLDSYQMRTIRLAGTVTAMQTEIITNKFVCGVVHERTKLTVEDDTGQIEVMDHGACGANRSVLKAPMVKVGEQIDLLVHVTVRRNSVSREPMVETTIRFIDRVQH